MQRKSKSTPDDSTKTARELLKAYLRANPNWLKGKEPEAALELHERFLSGVQAQFQPAQPDDRVLIVVNAQKPKPIESQVVEEEAS